MRAALRDELTTLISRPVFDMVLQQEAQRALRHEHGIAMLLFDIDDLSGLNRSHGYGAGDRLLERLGILARRFFRTHDWVVRHGPDSIAVLLPETTLDQASTLAGSRPSSAPRAASTAMVRLSSSKLATARSPPPGLPPQI